MIDYNIIDMVVMVDSCSNVGEESDAAHQFSIICMRGLATGAGDNTTIVIVPTITALALRLRLVPIIS